MLKAFTERVAVANTCREQFRWCWPSEVEEWFSGSGLILSGLMFYVYEAEVCPEIVDRENPRSSFLDAAQSWGCSWLCLAGSQCGSKPARPPLLAALVLGSAGVAVSEKSSSPYGGEGL